MRNKRWLPERKHKSSWIQHCPLKNKVQNLSIKTLLCEGQFYSRKLITPKDIFCFDRSYRKIEEFLNKTKHSFSKSPWQHKSFCKHFKPRQCYQNDSGISSRIVDSTGNGSRGLLVEHIYLNFSFQLINSYLLDVCHSNQWMTKFGHHLHGQRKFIEWVQDWWL